MQIRADIVSQWAISDADRSALADLPEVVPPFFHADPQDEAHPVMKGGFYRLGNDLGLEIGVSARGVFAVDPEGEIPDCFVNSTVADLAEFLRETGLFQAGVARMDEAEAAALAVEIRERLQRRDPAAFAPRTWWPMVFDQLENGQL